MRVQHSMSLVEYSESDSESENDFDDNIFQIENKFAFEPIKVKLSAKPNENGTQDNQTTFISLQFTPNKEWLDAISEVKEQFMKQVCGSDSIEITNLAFNEVTKTPKRLHVSLSLNFPISELPLDKIREIQNANNKKGIRIQFQTTASQIYPSNNNNDIYFITFPLSKSSLPPALQQFLHSILPQTARLPHFSPLHVSVLSLSVPQAPQQQRQPPTKIVLPRRKPLSARAFLVYNQGRTQIT